MVGLRWNNCDLWVNGLALVSVVCLAVPAFHADRYGRRQLRTLRGDWTAWKGGLPIAGMRLAALSSLLATIKALTARVP